MQKLIPTGFYLLFIFFFNPLFAQEKTEINMVFISNQTIADVNMNEDRFLNYAKKLSIELNSIFENDLVARDIVVFFTLQKDSLPTIQLSARPAFSADSVDLIQTKLRKIQTVKTKFIDFIFLFEISTQGGCANEKLQYSPEIHNPFVEADQEYQHASVDKKAKLLTEWVKNDALLILSAFQKKANPQFKGVRIIGDQIAAIKPDSIFNIQYLTAYNPFYWRAIMEMNINNFLVSTSKVFLHVAAGEFDIARRYLDMLKMFKEDKTIADYYLDELCLKLDSFYMDLNKEINKGINYREEGEYKKSIAVFDNILSYHPHSAKVLEEKFISSTIYLDLDFEHLNKKWNEYKNSVYTCDPLYPSGYGVLVEKEGWRLLRRLEINELFTEGTNASEEFVKYADIAFDLEAWDYAAHMYWLVFTHFSETDYGKKRNILAYYLYCLEKLGQHDILLLFNLNYSKEFKKIENERKKAFDERDSLNLMELKNNN